MIAGFYRNLLSASAACATLAACSGGFGSQSLPPANSPASQMPLASAFRGTPHPDRSRSWMNRDAASSALLYLSDDSTYDVYVYSWPQLSLVGTLTGFDGPSGECLGSGGNVWIVNTYASQLIEYAHGGTTPIATLNDAGEYPLSCAVDKKNGQLAAGNIESTSGGAGSVTLYPGASGDGTNYPDANVYIHAVGYDHGTLFVDGGSGSGYFSLQSFKKGTFAPITIIGGTIGIAGGLQDADGSLTIGDQLATSGSPVIYQMSKSGAIHGSTPLASGGGCVQYFIKGNKVICPNPNERNLLVYPYPAGGTAVKTITGSFSDPYAAVISP